jgi:hypothetical protein
MPYEMRALDVKFFEVRQFVSLAIQNHAILESLARSFFQAPELARESGRALPTQEVLFIV